MIHFFRIWERCVKLYLHRIVADEEHENGICDITQAGPGHFICRGMI